MVSKKCVREDSSHNMLKERLGTPITGQSSVAMCKSREGANAMGFQRKRSPIWLRHLQSFCEEPVEEALKVKYDFEGDIEENKNIQDSGIQQKIEPSKKLKIDSRISSLAIFSP